MKNYSLSQCSITVQVMFACLSVPKDLANRLTEMVRLPLQGSFIYVMITTTTPPLKKGKEYRLILHNANIYKIPFLINLGGIYFANLKTFILIMY